MKILVSEADTISFNHFVGSRNFSVSVRRRRRRLRLVQGQTTNRRQVPPVADENKAQSNSITTKCSEPLPPPRFVSYILKRALNVSLSRPSPEPAAHLFGRCREIKSAP